MPCADSPGPKLPEFCIAAPRIWAGGRPDENDLEWLMQHGIKTIVDLEVLHDDRRTFARLRVDDSYTYNIHYFHVLDWEPLPMIAPSVEDTRVAKILAITASEPAPILIHCRCGMKRTALMVAAHRVVIEGVSPESAIKEMSRYGKAWSGPDSRYIRALSERRQEMQRRIAEWKPELKPDAEIHCAEGRCSVSEP